MSRKRQLKPQWIHVIGEASSLERDHPILLLSTTAESAQSPIEQAFMGLRQYTQYDVLTSAELFSHRGDFSDTSVM